MTDMQLAIETRRAVDALAAVNVRGYDVPDAVTQAHACERQLEALALEPTKIGAISTDPAKLKASLTKMAADARAQMDLQTAIEKARDVLAGRTLAATRAAVPGWLNALQTDFAHAWKDFRGVWLSAPSELNGFSTDEQAAEHAQLLRSIAQLDQILSIRVVLGNLLHEPDADSRNVLLAAALPTVPARTDSVEAQWTPLGQLIDSWQGGHVLLTTGTRPAATGVEKWGALASTDGLTIGLADVTGLEQRTHVRDAWSTAISAVRHLGGMPASPDHLWRELIG
ncbi:hypothetical protein [Phycicoccus avicenniae]|uniref:hypothetical protein n=1 Tax=Phycicoccus avicenniae TaxID=2828860 RepID=UPI003D27EDC7